MTTQAPNTRTATTHSAASIGVAPVPCTVTVSLADGLPSIDVVGISEPSIRETRVRVRAAVGHVGPGFPVARIAVTVAPAHVRRDGTGLDLPIAVALLAANGDVPSEQLSRSLFFGELSLDGSVRPVRGALLAAEAAALAGCSLVIVAADNGAEAALAAGVTVRTVRHLQDVIAYFRGDDAAAPLASSAPALFTRQPPDFSEVRGQPVARRALEVSAAGGHNILLIGGPGAGKTMLARRLPGILPPLTFNEALEVTRVASVAGLNVGGGLVGHRPFRAPHHSTTAAGLVGGGAPIARPGELSLAHRGVLFLDELPEFSRVTLEMLREPLTSGEVALTRAAGVVAYPAKAMVVAAMNPCPCGLHGHPRLRCRCTASDVARYHARVSGPLLDAMDIQVDVPPVDLATLGDSPPGECSAVLAARVAAARERQHRRQGCLNSELTQRDLQAHTLLDESGRALVVRAMERLGLSGHGYDRVRRVARTIADLGNSNSVTAAHVAEALQMRRRHATTDTDQRAPLG